MHCREMLLQIRHSSVSSSLKAYVVPWCVSLSTQESFLLYTRALSLLRDEEDLLICTQT